MHQIVSYIKFLLKSTNQHGVHSPFVYNFVIKCLYDKTEYPSYTELKNYRTSLLNSKKILEITDFGAGSKLMNANKRAVSKMAKNSSSSFKDTKLLFRVSKYFQFKNTLELGTSLGIGTQAFSLGNTDNNIVTIEGCPNTYQFSKANFKRLNLSNITAKNGEFSKVISNLKTKTSDCIFFDGHHNKEATLNYFEALILKAHNDSIFIFDDIYWSKDMTEAWQQIISDARVTVSIDCFSLGFIFFRKEQVKEHFTIRL